LKKLIDTWEPDTRLELPAEALRQHLKEMANQKKEWAFHPCVSALTRQKNKSFHSDFQLAIWTTLHTKIQSLKINIIEELWSWSTTGDKKIYPGVYDLVSLSKTLFNSQVNSDFITLDIWGHSTDFHISNSWASKDQVSKEGLIQLGNEIITFFKGMDLLRTLFSECYNWISNVTKVVVPLARYPSNALQSNHNPEVPGMIYLDFFGGEINTIELMIHESAHFYFFLAEMNSRLIQPDHQELYWSPLRREKRPLRGIFLAYHALSYICSFYKDGISKGFISDKRYFRERDKHINQMQICGQTLDRANHALTSEGILFLKKTKEISKYALL
jgi:hypothetical protein